MKRAVAVLLIAALVVSCAAPAYSGPVRKFGRGVCNILTFPCELPNRMTKSCQDNGSSLNSVFNGFFTGLAMSLFRVIAGAYEVVSFPIPIPEKYEPILSDPEFFIGASNAKK